MSNLIYIYEYETQTFSLVARTAENSTFVTESEDRNWIFVAIVAIGGESVFATKSSDAVNWSSLSRVANSRRK